MLTVATVRASAAAFAILFSYGFCPHGTTTECSGHAYNKNVAADRSSIILLRQKERVEIVDGVSGSGNNNGPTMTTSVSSSRILMSNDGGDVVSNMPKIHACDANSNCVSSNYREPPNRYVSSFRIVNDPQVAFQRAVRDLQRIVDNDGNNSKMSIGGLSIVEIVPSAYYIHLTVPGTAPGSVDDIDLVFGRQGQVVDVKCEARRTLPPPPFCIKKNCINGNMDQRERVQRLGYILGLPPADQDEMAGSKWTPIFLNSDRVPGFDD